MRTLVMLGKDNRYIKLMAVFGVKPFAARAELLEFVNPVNAEHVIIRSALSLKLHSGYFGHFICLPGGVPRATMVQATKRFLKNPVEAIDEYGNELIQ